MGNSHCAARPVRTLTQRQRRRALEKAWEIKRAEAWERDNGTCVVCGRPAVTVNHIRSRGARIDLMLELSNLACLCEICDPEANTEKMIRAQYAVLSRRHGYEYNAYYMENR